MITPAGLADIAKYADGVGPRKRQFLSVKALAFGADGKPADFNGDGAVNEADGITIKNSNLVADAHTAGLFVHPYTFRTDVNFARNYAGGGRSNASAVNAEYRQMWNLGVDVLFSDFADDAVRSRSLFAADQVEVVEYANAADANVAARFFRTATDFDIRAVAAVKGLTRTTDTFKVWSTLQAGALATTAVCRYFDSKNSRHFFSIDVTQCAAYAAAGYSNEGTAFHAVPLNAATCATGTVAVNRFTRTVAGVADERLSTAQSIVSAVPAYSKSGVAFCGAL